MSERMLLREVASLLGHSCQNDHVLASSCSNENTGDTKDIVCSASSISYPSFSLTHHNESHHQQNGSPSREEVRLKASACMAQPVVLENDVVPNVNEKTLLKEVRCHMLENILDSLDHLVDARLHQYSKVLRNHGKSLSTTGQQIVEYKLRRLLEIGTNISFGSISTDFTATRDESATADAAGLPIVLTVEIDSLQLLHSSTEHRHRLKQTISFRAPGKIQGILEENRADDSCNTVLVKNDAAGSATASAPKRFKSLIVQVDCEVLLKEMMKQAGEIVGMVVELTNQAWAEQQAEDASAAAADAAAKEQESSNDFKKRKGQLEKGEPEGSRSPKLGAKTVSEVSFHPPVKEVSAAAAAVTAFALESQIEEKLEQPSLLHAYPMAVAGAIARDSDDENTNPSISAEKARHIIDYVFDEIDDDGFIPAPSVTKKPRIEL